jgi:hypothetical protein
VVLRRPPKTIADSGTPSGSLYSGATISHCSIGVQNREFGCAAGRPESGVQSLPLPVDQVLRDLIGHAFPPNTAVVRQSHVGEDRVALGDAAHRVGVGGPPGSGCDAEQAGLGVDHPGLAFVVEGDPGNVVPDHFGLPAFDGGFDHREVGLAAGRREGRTDVVGLALGVGDLQDQHVLRKPALVVRDGRGDAQGVALLAEQGISAVSRSEGPDRAVLGELHNVLVRVARPGDVVLPLVQRRAHGMEGFHEEGVLFLHRAQNVLPDGRHDAHRAHDVGGVRQFDAELRILGTQVAHDERDHVQRASTHATPVLLGQGRLHLLRIHPVVGGPGALSRAGADERALLHAGDVLRIGERGE